MADAVSVITPAKVDGVISVILMAITPRPLGRKLGTRCMKHFHLTQALVLSKIHLDFLS